MCGFGYKEVWLAPLKALLGARLTAPMKRASEDPPHAIRTGASPRAMCADQTGELS